MTSIADNSNALAAFVQNLGAEIVQARTFQFEIPLEEVRKVLPEIYKLGGLRDTASRYLKNRNQPLQRNNPHAHHHRSATPAQRLLRRGARAYGCAHQMTRRCSGLLGNAGTRPEEPGLQPGHPTTETRDRR